VVNSKLDKAVRADKVVVAVETKTIATLKNDTSLTQYFKIPFCFSRWDFFVG
jgi:ribosomal protein S26